MANNIDASFPIIIGVNGELIVKLYATASILISPSFQGAVNVNEMLTAAADITLPLIEIDTAGLDTCIGIANITLPMLVLQGLEGADSCNGIANLTLGLFRVEGSGADSAVGTANVNIPVFVVDGKGLDSVIGQSDIKLPMIKIETRSSFNEVGKADLKLPAIVVNGTLLRGAAGIADIVIPMVTLYGYGYSPAVGTANLTLPLFLLDAVTDLLNDLALSMNAKNNALTIYNNYGFNSLCNFMGKNLGAKQSGIFDLSGDLDGDDNVDWNFRTAALDLEVKQKKRLQQTWLGYRGSGDLKVKAILSNGDIYEYPVTLYDDFYRSRVKFGKGIRTRYIEIDVSSDEGAKIELDMIKLHFELLGEKR